MCLNLVEWLVVRSLFSPSVVCSCVYLGIGRACRFNSNFKKSFFTSQGSSTNMYHKYKLETPDLPPLLLAGDQIEGIRVLEKVLFGVVCIWDGM